MTRRLNLPFVAACVGPWVYVGQLFDTLPPEQRAAVLSHERGHVALGHWWGLLWPVGRQARQHRYEFEADEFAKHDGHAAGMVAYLEAHPSPATLSHPSTAERIARLLS